MNTFTIYSQPFIASYGRVRQQTIIVSARHDFAHYNGYAHFGVQSSNTSDNASNWGCCRPAKNEFVEWLLRDRRAIAFADASGLQPIPTPEDCPLLEVVKRMLYWDHISVWVSDRGTQFVLNEPYGKAYTNEVDTLRDAGLVRIEVPTPLAPYGGDWSGASGAQPGTRSFVIGFKSDEAELLEIAVKLGAAAASGPAWNDTTGLV